MNQKVIFAAIGVVVVAAAILFFSQSNMTTTGQIDVPTDTTSNQEAEEFATQLQALAKGDTDIIPVEGYDAELLLGMVSTLTEEDFDGVVSFEGIYTYDSGDLNYERTQGNPITSAEKTISNEGYVTLLANLETRLGVDGVEAVMAELSK